MSRAAVVIVNDEEKLALIERRFGGAIYYLLPGGAVEDDESPEEAATREAFEELGVHVKIDRLIAETLFRGNTQYYYFATITGGEFGTGKPGSRPEHKAGTYKTIWIPIDRISSIDGRPRALFQMLSTMNTLSWPEEVLQINEDDKDEDD